MKGTLRIRGGDPMAGVNLSDEKATGPNPVDTLPTMEGGGKIGQVGQQQEVSTVN